MTAKKNLPILLILSIALISTSCVSIVEKIFFNKDGGGTYSMTISIPEAVTPLSSGEKETKLASDFISKMEGVEKRFSKIKGISNVDIHANRQTFSTGIQFEFDDIEALNQALYLYYAPALKGDPSEKDVIFFAKEGKKTFIRKNRDILSTFLSKVFLSESDDHLKSLFVMKDAEAEVSITFEGTIKKNSNPDYKLRDKHSLYWKKYLYTKRHEDKEIGLSVKVK